MTTKILNNVRLIQKCLMVNKDGKILALKRVADDHSRGGNWDLPGGGYEEGENVIGAINREIMEEVGLKAESPKPFFFANRMGVEVGFFQGETVFATCYLCKNWEGEVALSSEHSDFKWVTPEEFKSLNFGADSGFFSEAITEYISLYR